MTKNEKENLLRRKYVFEKLKRAALVAASAVTGLTVGGCEVSNKKDEAVANNNIVFIDEQTDATTSTIESTETTTTFKPINTDIHRRKYVDGNDSSSDTEYVETSYENDLITSSTTVTSTKNSNDNVVINDNTTTSKTTTRPASKTSPDTDKTTTKTTKTTPKTTKTTSDTTKTTTSKTTTRPTTSKTTTTVTTTTEAVTEPPVTEPEYDIYDLNNIGSNKYCFESFSNSIRISILSNYSSNAFVTIDIGYGPTPMGYECSLILESLNNIYCDNEYINAECYKKIDAAYLDNCKYFMYNFKIVKDYFQSDFDYSRYTINKTVGNFLNEADEAYRNGSFDQFMADTIGCGNVSPDVLDNPGAMAILYSYDNGEYLNYDDVDSKLNVVVNHISEQAFGYGYAK